MTDDLNTVKTSRAYHHGALRPALMAAAEQLIAERGLDGFSLRETARRAGVSPSAPAHHFGDMRGLLTAIAIESFDDLSAAIAAADAAAGDGRVARVGAQAIAYVNYALANRARYDLMWRPALLQKDDEDYSLASKRAFAVLDRAIRGEDRTGGPNDVEAAPSIACWALVHGFARLALDGMLGSDEEAARRAAELLLPQVMTSFRIPRD